MEIAGAHVVLHKTLTTGKKELLAVLLYKRTLDAPLAPGYWGLFGGRMEPKDHGDPKATAKREVEEELDGSEDALGMLSDLCTVPVPESETTYVQYFSASLQKDMDSLRLKWNDEENKVEGDGFAWFTLEEVHHMLMRPEDRIALTNFFQAHT